MLALRAGLVALTALLAPFQYSGVRGTALQSRGVTQDLLNDLNLFSQYAAATYCDDDDSGTAGAKITCTTGNCPLVQAAGATILESYLNQGLLWVAGFLALDPTNKLLVLTFRGAEGTGYLTTIPQFLTPCTSFCAECNCHAGFYASWLEARDIVSAALAKNIALYPDYKVVVTGHSLGAAQAAYAAAEIRKNGTQATFYNFGQPRLGDLAFSTFVSQQGNNYRVTHTDDPAPRIGDPSEGFRHISPEYWISRDANSNYTVSSGQIVVIEGYNNMTGNAGTGGFDAAAHVEYFQSDLAACTPIFELVFGP